MSWQNELTIITRTLINDLNEPYEFSDERLQQLLVVSGKYVQWDVNLSNSYTFDVINNNISPDPVVTTKDEIFNSLCPLKAACMLDQSNLRTKAAFEGIRTSLGSANLSVQGSLQGFLAILDKGPCALYSELTEKYDMRNVTAWSAILTPFVNNRFDPRYLNAGPFRNVGNNDFYS